MIEYIIPNLKKELNQKLIIEHNDDQITKTKVPVILPIQNQYLKSASVKRKMSLKLNDKNIKSSISKLIIYEKSANDQQEYIQESLCSKQLLMSNQEQVILKDFTTQPVSEKIIYNSLSK